MAVAVNPNQPVDDQKQCWICLASDGETAQWVKPCKCRGTMKWVHQSCLQRWLDEKQNGNPLTTVTCSQCKAEYLLQYPPLGVLTTTLAIIDKVVDTVCPMAVESFAYGTIYGVLTFYGGVIVYVVIGNKEGDALMLSVEPGFLAVALPIIPICLVVGQMVQWEDKVVEALVRLTFKNGQVQRSNPSKTRILCMALGLPLVSKIVGNWLFENYTSSQVYRTLLGGAVFLTVKGVATVFYRYQQFCYRQRRIILDYDGSAAVPSNTSNDTKNTNKP